eukprot:jgi/Mesvir1/8628/Mv02578-RA.1
MVDASPAPPGGPGAKSLRGKKATPAVGSSNLLLESKTRWLKAYEVYELLRNSHEYLKLSEETPVEPASGSLFLYDRRNVKFFRKDGHEWQKKKDGKALRETHEKLKVNNVETLNCYYAHLEGNDNFQRRCYWLLEGTDEPNDNYVVVHYLQLQKNGNEDKETKQNGDGICRTGSASELSVSGNVEMAEPDVLAPSNYLDLAGLDHEYFSMVGKGCHSRDIPDWGLNSLCSEHTGTIWGGLPLHQLLGPPQGPVAGSSSRNPPPPPPPPLQAQLSMQPPQDLLQCLQGAQELPGQALGDAQLSSAGPSLSQRGPSQPTSLEQPTRMADALTDLPLPRRKANRSARKPMDKQGPSQPSSNGGKPLHTASSSSKRRSQEPLMVRAVSAESLPAVAATAATTQTPPALPEASEVSPEMGLYRGSGWHGQGMFPPGMLSPPNLQGVRPGANGGAGLLSSPAGVRSGAELFDGVGFASSVDAHRCPRMDLQQGYYVLTDGQGSARGMAWRAGPGQPPSLQLPNGVSHHGAMGMSDFSAAQGQGVAHMEGGLGQGYGMGMHAGGAKEGGAWWCDADISSVANPHRPDDAASPPWAASTGVAQSHRGGERLQGVAAVVDHFRGTLPSFASIIPEVGAGEACGQAQDEDNDDATMLPSPPPAVLGLALGQTSKGGLRLSHDGGGHWAPQLNGDLCGPGMNGDVVVEQRGGDAGIIHNRNSSCGSSTGGDDQGEGQKGGSGLWGSLLAHAMMAPPHDHVAPRDQPGASNSDDESHGAAAGSAENPAAGAGGQDKGAGPAASCSSPQPSALPSAQVMSPEPTVGRDTLAGRDAPLVPSPAMGAAAMDTSGGGSVQRPLFRFDVIDFCPEHHCVDAEVVAGPGAATRGAGAGVAGGGMITVLRCQVPLIPGLVGRVPMVILDAAGCPVSPEAAFEFYAPSPPAPATKSSSSLLPSLVSSFRGTVADGGGSGGGGSTAGPSLSPPVKGKLASLLSAAATRAVAWAAPRHDPTLSEALSECKQEDTSTIAPPTNNNSNAGYLMNGHATNGAPPALSDGVAGAGVSAAYASPLASARLSDGGVGGGVTCASAGGAVTGGLAGRLLPAWRRSRLAVDLSKSQQEVSNKAFQLRLVEMVFMIGFDDVGVLLGSEQAGAAAEALTAVAELQTRDPAAAAEDMNLPVLFRAASAGELSSAEHRRREELGGGMAGPAAAVAGQAMHDGAAPVAMQAVDATGIGLASGSSPLGNGGGLAGGGRSAAEEDLRARLSTSRSNNPVNKMLKAAGFGLIHICAALGYAWAVKSICEAGAPVDMRDTRGRTALHWAAVRGKEVVVATLIEAGADPCTRTAKNRRGSTPAELAAACGHARIASYLSEITLRHSITDMTLRDGGRSSEERANNNNNISSGNGGGGDGNANYSRASDADDRNNAAVSSRQEDSHWNGGRQGGRDGRDVDSGESGRHEGGDRHVNPAVPLGHCWAVGGGGGAGNGQGGRGEHLGAGNGGNGGGMNGHWSGPGGNRASHRLAPYSARCNPGEAPLEAKPRPGGGMGLQAGEPLPPVSGGGQGAARMGPSLGMSGVSRKRIHHGLTSDSEIEALRQAERETLLLRSMLQNEAYENKAKSMGALRSLGGLGPLGARGGVAPPGMGRHGSDSESCSDGEDRGFVPPPSVFSPIGRPGSVG